MRRTTRTAVALVALALFVAGCHAVARGPAVAPAQQAAGDARALELTRRSVTAYLRNRKDGLVRRVVPPGGGRDVRWRPGERRAILYRRARRPGILAGSALDHRGADSRQTHSTRRRGIAPGRFVA